MGITLGTPKLYTMYIYALYEFGHIEAILGMSLKWSKPYIYEVLGKN